MSQPKEMQVRMVEYDDDMFGVHFQQYIDWQWRDLEIIKLPLEKKPDMADDNSIAFA